MQNNKIKAIEALAVPIMKIQFWYNYLEIKITKKYR